MKRSSLIVLLSATFSLLFAQQREGVVGTFFKGWNDKEILNHLNVSVIGGSTGFGIELSSPITEFVNVRAGYEIMPGFEKTVNFGVQVGDKKPDQTEEEFAAVSQSKFEKLSGFLKSFTGQEVNDNVDMVGNPKFYNFKFIVDVHPFAKSSHKGLKDFYVAAGFYLGNSRIAKAYNTTEDMPTLFAVCMYNSMYEKFTVKDENDMCYYHYNQFFPGYRLDPDIVDIISDKFGDWGRMGMHIGDYAHDVYNEAGEKIHSKGDRYVMEPDEDCMVKADIKVNRFKPYLGIGYASDLAKSKAGWGYAVELGTLFWGGSPSIVTHDGTDLVNDLENVRGKVGKYTDLIKGFKVYPVFNLKITKRIF